MRYILLNPSDVHLPGDEIYLPIAGAWEEIDDIHIGDQVGEDSYPCRREYAKHPGSVERQVQAAGRHLKKVPSP